MNSSASVANRTCFPSTLVWPAILLQFAVKETPLFVMFQCGRACFCILMPGMPGEGKVAKGCVTALEDRGTRGFGTEIAYTQS